LTDANESVIAASGSQCLDVLIWLGFRIWQAEFQGELIIGHGQLFSPGA
jgi:hypothetical protein